jgi:chemotaxis protein CheD
VAPDIGLAEIYVQPGESHLITEPMIFRTVLGSCVGVAFLARARGIAALCHPMLPQLPAQRRNRLELQDARRYADFAIQDIARQFDAYGIRPGDVEVKLFGGADVLPIARHATRSTVGTLNSEMAERVLREEGFVIAASSLGGTSGIRLEFHTGTGEVRLRRLNHAEETPATQRNGSKG